MLLLLLEKVRLAPYCKGISHECLVWLQMFLKELAEQTGGRYHCYVSTSDVSHALLLLNTL